MLEKVSSGTAFQPAAGTWNAFVDAAVDFKQRKKGGSAGSNRSKSDLTIDVTNKTGGNLDRYQAVKLGDPATIPDGANNDPEFLNRIVMNGDTPDDDSKGRWAVNQVALSDGAIGPAIAVGVTQARIGLSDVTHTHVEVQAGGTLPVSGTSGSARILWVAGGVGTATAPGEQWAIIKLGGSDAEVLFGILTSDVNVATYLELTPCKADGTVADPAPDPVKVLLAGDHSPCAGPWGTNQIFAYLPATIPFVYPADPYDLAYVTCDGVALSIPLRARSVIACNLTQNGGSDGDGTTEPTYTYDVFTEGVAIGFVSGGPYTPLADRPKGSFTPASNGLGCWERDGTFSLLQAFEKRNITLCGGG